MAHTDATQPEAAWMAVLSWTGLSPDKKDSNTRWFLAGHCQFVPKNFLIWKHLDDSPTNTTSQTTPHWIFWVVAAQLFLDASVLATRNSKNHLLWNAGSGMRVGTVTTGTFGDLQYAGFISRDVFLYNSYLVEPTV